MYRILIVEDDLLVQQLLHAKVKRAGYKATLCQTAEEALERVEHPDTRPDLILADLMLPNMNGYEMIARIRDVANTVDLPIIVVSSVFEEEAVDKAMEVGANDFLLKPTNYNELLGRIESCFNLRASAHKSLQTEQHTMLRESLSQVCHQIEQSMSVLQTELELLRYDIEDEPTKMIPPRLQSITRQVRSTNAMIHRLTAWEQQGNKSQAVRER